MNLKEKYGSVALVAGASEGLGAAYAYALASHGLDVFMVARRKDVLEKTTDQIRKQYGVKVFAIACDLAEEHATSQIRDALGKTEVNFLVYNAAQAYIGPFLSSGESEHVKSISVNITTPMKMVYEFGRDMVAEKKGGIV